MTDDPPLDQAATTTNALLLPDAVLYAFDILPDGRAEALETAELSKIARLARPIAGSILI